MTEITGPLRCAKCAKTFFLEDGGLCQYCQKLFCRRHLKFKVRKSEGSTTRDVLPQPHEHHSNLMHKLMGIRWISGILKGRVG